MHYSNVPASPIYVTEIEFCSKTKLSCFKSVYVPVPPVGHIEGLIMNERVRFRVQAAKWRFFLCFHFAAANLVFSFSCYLW